MLELLVRHRNALRAGSAVVLLAAFAVTTSVRGLGMGLLVLAGGLLLLAVALIWSSVQSLTGEAPLTLDEALSLAAPRAEEEQKRAVLRALKDLEYERSVGKISEEDYVELSARYREQAKLLLRTLDAELAPTRQRVERLLEKRLARAGAPGKTEPEPAPAADAEVDEAPARTGPTRRCGDCSVRNELDAQFCKACGKPLAEDGEQLCQVCPARFDSALDACPDCGVALVREA